MTTCLTASFNSFRSSLHSILDGTRLREGRSTASLLRGEKPGFANYDGDHSHLYIGFPALMRS
jgi:hypothetical protein